VVPSFPRSCCGLLAALLLAACFGQVEKPGAEELEKGRGGGPQAAKARGAGGIEIAYTVYGEGEQTLVLVHGWGGSQRIWASQVDDLAQRYTVVTVDLGGHGLSGRPAKASLAGLAQDLVAVLDAVGARRVVLIGHSMGGLVSLLAAKERPQMVAGMIGAEAFYYPPAKQESWQALLGQLAADFPTVCRSFLRGQFAATTEEPLVESTADQFCQIDPEVGIALLRDYSVTDLGKVLAALPPAMPVRSIAASAELEPPPAPPSEPLQRFHADLKTSFIARCGHFPMLEQSAELTRQLAAALEEIERRP
jgi:pimeloyl-ACP methyl ester carboxylesterase